MRPHPWAPPAPCCGAQAFAARSGRPRAPSPARPSAGRPTRPFCPLRPGAVSRESAAQGARRRPGSGDRSSPGSRLGGKESAAVSLGGLGGTEHSSAPAELHRRTSRGRPPRSPRLPPPDQRPHCGALLNRWWGRFLIGRSGSTRQAPGLWARRVIFPELFILLLKGGGRAAVQRCKLLNRRKREGRLAESCTCPAWLTGGDARGVGQPGPRGDVSGEIPSRTGRRPGRSSAWGRGSQPRTHPGGDL